MHFLMVFVLVALLAMAFVTSSPVPNPDGEVVVVVNQLNPNDWTTTTSAW
ncbi:uncharacterized protein LOC108087529 [Drosophila ficusphila]|nr:uncharacterized protein LOC108087529 [Drosophila ficusphila]